MAKDCPRIVPGLSHHWLVVSLVLGIACFGAYRDDIARSHRSTRATRGVRLDCDHAHPHADGTVDFGHSYDEPLALDQLGATIAPPRFSGFIQSAERTAWQPASSRLPYFGRAPPPVSSIL